MGARDRERQRRRGDEQALGDDAAANPISPSVDSGSPRRPGPAMSTKRVLCKFFMHGACLKGDYCEFSHDWSDQSNNVCTFYQKGSCSYGSRCRYDHVKVSRKNPVPPLPSSSTAARNSLVPLPPSSNTATRAASTSLQLLSPGRPLHLGHQTNSSNQRQQVSTDLLALSGSKPAWKNEVQLVEDGIDWSFNQAEQNQTSIKLADMPICSFAAAGNCPYAEECPHMHGDMCAVCGKMCLHPYRPDERQEHIKLCEKNHKRLEALKRSQEIECSVCLDRVLSKPTAAERKFGLLSECDHPFCISCIRNWRGNSPSSGMDVNSALRACPICRKLSYYVIPSVLWYFSKEEKLEITENYKVKLKSIDCKYFDFGTGTCPFGTSCFYKHAYRDGRLEEVTLRHLDCDDGSTLIAKNIRLSDFLSRLHL